MNRHSTLILIFGILLSSTIYSQKDLHFPDPDNLARSTVLIQGIKIVNEEGKLIPKPSQGTGFIFQFKVDSSNNKAVPVIVTNKHVISDMKVGKLIFSLIDSTGKIIKGKTHTEEIINFDKNWFFHPDPNVDLCVMKFGPIYNNAKEKGINLNYQPLRISSIPDKETWDQMSGIEEVIMIGYPKGVWDSANNAPVIRQGLTATDPKLDYLNKKEFLVDIPVFPGSSGSPVLIYNRGAFVDFDDELKFGNRINLIGIAYGSIDFFQKGEIKIENIPTEIESNVKMPLNLAVVIKAERLREIEKIMD